MASLTLTPARRVALLGPAFVAAVAYVAGGLRLWWVHREHPGFLVLSVVACFGRLNIAGAAAIPVGSGALRVTTMRGR